METDSLFYRLFKEKPKLVFELLGEKPPRTAYTFGSHELKQTSLRADGILEPKSPKSPIVFVEAQGYLDRENKVYPSFFAKIFMYLRDETPVNDWRAVMVFAKRGYDPGLPIHYQDFLPAQRLHLVYLDEMPDRMADQSLEVSLVQLIGLDKKVAFDRAKTILEQTQAQTSDAIEQQRVLEWVVTVFVHKFPKLSREEIKTMLGTKAELKKTRFYLEVEDEILSRAVLPLLKSGMTVKEVAAELQVSIKRVNEFIKIAQAEN
jgi:predicted transposase/invertase (TIGR01784 family)